MNKWVLVAAFLVPGTVVRAADDPPPKPAAAAANAVDPDAYQAALERLRSRSTPAAAAPGSTPAQATADVESLRAENAALRQRVAELELMLGLKNHPGGGPARAPGGKTYQTLTELINTTRYPADPRRKWTKIQLDRANHDVRANILGARYQATAFFVDAASEKGEIRCKFRRTSKAEGADQEHIFGTFDARYSDLITSWRAGQGVTIAGTIATADLYQAELTDGTRDLRLRITLSDCVPK